MASDWFSKFLDVRVTLLYFDPAVCKRKVDPADGTGKAPAKWNRQGRPNEDNATVTDPLGI